MVFVELISRSEPHSEPILESKDKSERLISNLQEAWDVSTDGYVYFGADGSLLLGNEKTRELFAGCRHQSEILQRFSRVDEPDFVRMVQSSPIWLRCKGYLSTSTGELVNTDIETIPVTGGCWLVVRLIREPLIPQPPKDFTSAVFDNAEAIILVLDKDGRFVRFNKQAQSVTGYSEEEVRGNRLLDLFIKPEDVATVEEEILRVVSGQYPSHLENAWIMRDGSVSTIAWSNTGLLDAQGNVAYIVSTGIDVTAVRGAESAMASLSEQAMNQMQGERRKLSRFLHDTVSQDLVALSFSLSRLQQDQKSPALLKSLNRSLQLLDRCCRDIRLLSYILAPPMFDEIGLIPALEWYGGQLQREAGMSVELHFDPLPDPPPPPEVQSLLFAALQACVARSVRRLDKAKKRIALVLDSSGPEQWVRLEYESFFEPDGSSHAQREEFQEEFSVIRERLRLFRGKLDIEQGPESISVLASVPLKAVTYESP